MNSGQVFELADIDAIGQAHSSPPVSCPRSNCLTPRSFGSKRPATSTP